MATGVLDTPTTPTTPPPAALPPVQGVLQVEAPPNAVLGYTPATATADKPTSNAYNVTPNQTVQGQLKDIIAADSPLMQQADARARAAMNARGLLNTSIGVGAGQTAVMDKALPIAQQDAYTFAQANQKTVDAQNAALMRGSELQTNVAMQNAEQTNAASKAATGDFNARAQQLALANLDVQSRQLLQANANAQEMFQEVVKNIAGIAVDSTLSKEAKDAATTAQLNLLREGLATTAGISSTLPANVQELNLQQYFNTNPANMTPAQKQQQVVTLQQAVSSAQAAIPIWGDPKFTGQYEVHDGRKRESERTAQNFNKLLSQKTQLYQDAVRKLKEFQELSGSQAPA